MIVLYKSLIIMRLVHKVMLNQEPKVLIWIFLAKRKHIQNSGQIHTNPDILQDIDFQQPLQIKVMFSVTKTYI